MKAVIYDKKSGPDRLAYGDVEKPIPKANEILVEIHATSINAADYRMIQMGFPPKSNIFGADVSGIVESVGTKVTKFKPGDPVIGALSDCGFGGLAEYVAAPEKAFILKPKEISFEEAAAFPLAATTALQAVRNQGGVKKDDHVLIVGCSGGVGSYALQFAKYYGAIVTGVCSSKNEEQSRILGADDVIDYGKVRLSQTTGQYDLILGINGHETLSQYGKLLKPHGRYVMVGGAMGQIFQAILFGWMWSFGSKKFTALAARSSTGDMEFILKLAREGKIRPVIDKVYGLCETAAAMRYIKEEHAKGKVIIRVK